MTGYDIVEMSELAEMSDEELEPVLALVNTLDRESRPRHVDMSVDELRIIGDSPGMVERLFLVVDSVGTLVALATSRHPDDGSNADTLMCQIRVSPEHRRRGIGTALLRRLAGIASQLGRDSLQAFVFDTVPAGREFARRVGAVEQMDHHENILRISELDRSLMESWVAQGPERAPGYRVDVVEGFWPEETWEDLAHLFYVLERDMPLSPSFEPREWDAGLVSEIQDHYADAFDSLTSLAMEAESGRTIGMSDMIRRKADPTTWMVTTTMVDPDHRGKSLGKWLKGAVNLAALERWPGGVYQETGNAFTNEPMLAINHAMGFEHELTLTDYALSLDTVRGYLATRS